MYLGNTERKYVIGVDCFVTGISELLTNNLAHLFPNPSSDIINIPISELNSVNQIMIYSITGNRVFTEGNSIGKNSVELKIDHLPSGFYTIVMQTMEGNIARSFIKK